PVSTLRSWSRRSRDRRGAVGAVVLSCRARPPHQRFLDFSSRARLRSSTQDARPRKSRKWDGIWPAPLSFVTYSSPNVSEVVRHQRKTRWISLLCQCFTDKISAVVDILPHS